MGVLGAEVKLISSLRALLICPAAYYSDLSSLYNSRNYHNEGICTTTQKHNSSIKSQQMGSNEIYVNTILNMLGRGGKSLPLATLYY